MSDMIAQMIKMVQEISEALPSRKEDMFDTHNLDQENPCIIDDHDKSYAELTVKVKVEDELTTNMELKPILKERVEELIHFLAVVEKVLVKEVDKFDQFSFDKSNKA
ncbi:hypothetical protein PVK06_017437 [Gossypium arboreum]|uniref:Ty3-gypsy retrotransposon protein n=1 Tax=Gossypium arboreum TaxID=29729 RepID=A0ABR0Q2M6_GOSAR|nr:hypothetical protein PVK06_017437 [Gossypium arboreum]